jgi:hypothetical protein
MEMSGKINVPTIKTQGKSPWYPLKTKVGRPQNPSGYLGQVKIAPAGN